jgi:hypothetical protein
MAKKTPKKSCLLLSKDMISLSRKSGKKNESISASNNQDINMSYQGHEKSEFDKSGQQNESQLN